MQLLYNYSVQLFHQFYRKFLNVMNGNLNRWENSGGMFNTDNRIVSRKQKRMYKKKRRENWKIRVKMHETQSMRK